ncbi:acetyl-CoA carboxylase carboxyl transferase subunit alpha [Salicibibacter cibarius]|uniref:Acetyl-coenzyme A carboxylase carboxyl transferase subunit alpha n=1 Tax=Salicibibacter cibarius TaxID=2743000 RepID=A0A7T6Z5D0_9BACI|nr:acetyl-CoA carboxylase carboxyl transferase subunit alpha [Salicibibacter cibarius]QQK77293.1 acetyl-CoA carboxylase carboxyl transferase subunit alpha [Salicibibacter cibarius]
MSQNLPFEKPVVELQNKINELKNFTENKDINLESEIRHLEERLQELEVEIYDELSPWERVQIARHAERPTTLDYIDYLFSDFLELHGDRLYGDDEAIISGIATYKGLPVTVIGHQRGRNTKENIRRNFGSPHPEGYRKALRVMKQADKFSRPIICFIDTKGAFPGKASEERGISEAIARNLMEMAGFGVPSIGIVIGEGGSGGALALGVCNHMYMLANATYSVISPEGAATILWKDASQAQKAAETMRITAPDLDEFGIIDGIIPEVRGGAHYDIRKQAGFIERTLDGSLANLSTLSSEELRQHRFEKFNRIGKTEE